MLDFGLTLPPSTWRDRMPSCRSAWSPTLASSVSCLAASSGRSKVSLTGSGLFFEWPADEPAEVAWLFFSSAKDKQNTLSTQFVLSHLLIKMCF